MKRVCLSTLLPRDVLVLCFRFLSKHGTNSLNLPRGHFLESSQISTLWFLSCVDAFVCLPSILPCGSRCAPPRILTPAHTLRVTVSPPVATRIASKCAIGPTASLCPIPSTPIKCRFASIHPHDLRDLPCSTHPHENPSQNMHLVACGFRCADSMCHRRRRISSLLCCISRWNDFYVAHSGAVIESVLLIFGVCICICC